ncbi:MAG: phosphate signaling complex PhoU family protein [Planctomycetota bacterium]|jgi:phosphate uptake regulator
MLNMIKALFESDGSSTNLIGDARDQVLTMLDQAGELLTAALPHLLDHDAPQALSDQARSVDKASNQAEREIRKMLVEHLAFSQSDGPVCLVLMSVAKDCERLIDECRNLLDLRELIQKPVPTAYADDLRELVGEVCEIMATTRGAFAADDQPAALTLVEGEKPFISRLTAIQDRILDDTDMDQRQAVVTSRAFRVTQRVRAHLANIASTVIFPIHRIDFAKRKYVEDARREIER